MIAGRQHIAADEDDPTMADFTLYCFAQSGNAYKAALMLNLCEAKWAPRFVDFFDGETRSAEYRERINEMGEVPVLEHRGRLLAQSGVILDYLACTLGRFGWHDDDERREILRWTLWDNHKLTSYIATLRFMLQFAKTGDTPVTEFLRGRTKGALAILDKHLDTAPFAVAGRPTIADLSMCGYLFWNDEFGVSWDDYPNVGEWLERIRALPGWVHPYELMPGHPLPAKS
ncbi:MAG: glutathione binding-like protein [Burkholderiales bacterium]|jgi:glutathione S-transferase|nr:glutathione binding-like protein [Burkholderiales bacterium]